MVAYSFKQRFIEPILSGAKRQTIRAERKRHARPADDLQLYFAMRTRHCRLIGRAICTSVRPVRIQIGASSLVQFYDDEGRSVGLTPGHGIDDFARLDGFEDWQEMRRFWEENHAGLSVFSGWMIRWGGFKPASLRSPLT